MILVHCSSTKLMEAALFFWKVDKCFLPVTDALCSDLPESDASSPASPHPDGCHPGREGSEPLSRALAVKSPNIAKEMKETLVRFRSFNLEVEWFDCNDAFSAGRSGARFPYRQNFRGTVWIPTTQWVRCLNRHWNTGMCSATWCIVTYIRDYVFSELI